MMTRRWSVILFLALGLAASCSSDDGVGDGDPAIGVGGEGGATAGAAGYGSEPGGSGDTAGAEEGPAGATSTHAGSGNLSGTGGADGGEASGGQDGGPSSPVWTMLDAGMGLSCALDSEHNPLCWGDDSFGQVSEIRGPLSFIAVGSDNHVCGLKPDGTAVCWGDDREGQSSPPSDEFKSLAAGGNVTCGLRLDGSVTCWGKALGVTSAPLNAPLPGKFESISVGTFLCGIGLDGSLACADNARLPDLSGAKGKTYRAVATGQADMICAIRSDGELQCFGGFRDYGWDVPAGPFKAVAIGLELACAVRENGELACSGAGTAPAGPFNLLTAAGARFCATRLDGTLKCWGIDPHGAGIVPGSPFKAIVAGIGKFCGLRTDESVSCWGGAADAVPAGPFARIYAGGYYACGIRPDGTSACWPDLPLESPFFARDNLLGFGLGMAMFCQIKADATVPCSDLFFMPGTYKEVAAATYVCGIRTDGTLYCKEGNGETLPTIFPPTGTFTALSLSVDFACALRTDGTLACWGDESIKQGVPEGQFTAVATAGFEAANRSQYVRLACGLRDNGDVTCWGEAKSAISRAGPFVSLAVNERRACAVTPQGVVDCWADGGNTAAPSWAEGPDGVFYEVIR